MTLSLVWFAVLPWTAAAPLELEQAPLEQAPDSRHFDPRPSLRAELEALSPDDPQAAALRRYLNEHLRVGPWQPQRLVKAPPTWAVYQGESEDPIGLDVFVRLTDHSLRPLECLLVRDLDLCLSPEKGRALVGGYNQALSMRLGLIQGD